MHNDNEKLFTELSEEEIQSVSGGSLRLTDLKSNNIFVNAENKIKTYRTHTSDPVKIKNAEAAIAELHDIYYNSRPGRSYIDEETARNILAKYGISEAIEPEEIPL